MASRLLSLVPIACPWSYPMGPLGPLLCLLPGLLQASRGRTSRGGGPGLLLCGLGPTLPGDSTVLCPLRSHGTCRTQLLLSGFRDSGLFFCVIGGWRALCDVSGCSPEGSHRRYVPVGLSGFLGGSWLLLPVSALGFAARLLLLVRLAGPSPFLKHVLCGCLGRASCSSARSALRPCV